MQNRFAQGLAFLLTDVVLCFMSVVFFQCSGDQGSISTEIPEDFKTNCISCHGEDLRGAIAQSLIDGSWQFGTRDSDIFRSIKFGHPHFGMPSWGSVLDDEKIWQLVKFIRGMEEDAGAGRLPLPESLETLDYHLGIEVITEELETPWGIAFPDDNTVLITEKTG